MPKAIPDNTVDLDIERVLIETDKALLVRLDGENYWVPKSAIHDDSEVYCADSTGLLLVAEWWAEEKGLI